MTAAAGLKTSIRTTQTLLRNERIPCFCIACGAPLHPQSTQGFTDQCYDLLKSGNGGSSHDPRRLRDYGPAAGSLH